MNFEFDTNKPKWLEHLKVATIGDSVLITKIVQSFIINTPKEINLMKTYLDHDEYYEIFRLTHKIKPRFKLFQINRAFQICEQIETFEHRSKRIDKRFLKNHIFQLENVVAVIVKELKSEIHKIDL